MDLRIKGENKDNISLTKNDDNNISYIFVNAKLDNTKAPDEFCISWQIPLIDCYSIWNPYSGTIGSMGAQWNKKKMQSTITYSMPLQMIVSSNGNNRICVAVSDTMNPISIGMGVIEEDGCMACEVRFFVKPVSPMSEYKTVIRIDMRDIPFYSSIYDVTSWWEKDCGYVPARVPEIAKLPMDSLWYSFHQMLSPEKIIRECKEAKTLGMETVIIDDGWQTDDSNRGYAYCGDWKPANAKVGDLKELVCQIHKIGMKIVLWYSVPMVGIYSKKYNELKDMFLHTNPDKKTFILDPRYKEVRDYIINTYKNAVINYGLDGLKLDFIDCFALFEDSSKPNDRMDYTAVEEAVDILMNTIREVLYELNPDIMIEFRQPYVGPAIRKYGNMLRVADCPNDSLTNRRNIINLRLTSGQTAVHSDMCMWNMNDKVESAAMQFTSVMFGVPQISVRLDKISEENKKMLKFYLNFWRKYREVLLDGDFRAECPEVGYSIASSRLGNTEIFCSYTDTVISSEYKEIIAVNVSNATSLILKNCQNKKYAVYSCIGEKIERGIITERNHEICVPLSGVVFVDE